MVPEIPREDLAKARLGDRSAFRRVADALARYTYNLAWRMTYDSADAEDLSQEILLRLYQNLDRYDPALPFGPWFRRLATNRALNWKRDRKSRPQPIENVEVAVEAALPDESAERLRAALQKLPDEYRMAVTLYYLEGLPVEDVARAMNKPAGTIKTWLFRARDELKEKLKEHVRP